MAVSTTTVLQLENVRKQNGVSLEQISDNTKISTHFLRAIESEEFEKLPGGVFNTNYIRQYASAIGFAESKLLEHYNSYEIARKEADERAYPVRRHWTNRWFDRFRSLAPSSGAKA
jgi:cytoskeleton protein RodZ